VKNSSLQIDLEDLIDNEKKKETDKRIWNNKLVMPNINKEMFVVLCYVKHTCKYKN
jgi:hypothetical protein